MNMKNINDEKSTFNEKKNKIMGHIGHLDAQYIVPNNGEARTKLIFN